MPSTLDTPESTFIEFFSFRTTRLPFSKAPARWTNPSVFGRKRVNCRILTGTPEKAKLEEIFFEKARKQKTWIVLPCTSNGLV